MIIIDLSQVAIASSMAFKKDLVKGSTDKESMANIIRHAILSGIKYYKKKFGNEYGELVLACDSTNVWRKDVFPYYKANRKSKREQSDIDWKTVFDIISSIREDLKKHFPYKVIEVEKAEADDIIATLSQIKNEPVIIVSSDHDFKQLHVNKNVKQWSPIQMKYVTCDDPIQYLMEHIARGDSGDGAPNVLSSDDVFVTDGVRQTKLSKKRLDAFIQHGRDACENDFQRKNWDRNNTLVNLKMIPEDIVNTIIDKYNTYVTTGDKMTIFNYLVANRCSVLLNEIEEF